MTYQILGFYFLWNIFTMAVVGLDKHKARHNRWRISESTLLSLACAMGGVGVFLGMQLFSHKTQHVKFTTGVPLAIGLNVAIVIFTWKYLIKQN